MCAIVCVCVYVCVCVCVCVCVLGSFCTQDVFFFFKNLILYSFQFTRQERRAQEEHAAEVEQLRKQRERELSSVVTSATTQSSKGSIVMESISPDASGANASASASASVARSTATGVDVSPVDYSVDEVIAAVPSAAKRKEVYETQTLSTDA